MRLYPGYSQDGLTSQRLVGVAYFNATDMGGTVNLPGGVGQQVDRGPFVVAGFNSFMLTGDSTTGSTIRIFFIHLDPETAANVIAVQNADTIVTAGPVLQTWGAFAAVGQTHGFISMRVRFENRGAGAATWVNPRMWASAR